MSSCSRVSCTSQCRSANGSSATHLGATGGLRPGLDPDRARDTVWMLDSPDVYRRLVLDRSLSHDDYAHWLADTLTAALL